MTQLKLISLLVLAILRFGVISLLCALPGMLLTLVCLLQALMEGGLLGASMPQPIDACLDTLARLMVSGPLAAPVMSSSWQPLDILGKSSGSNAKKDLLGSILTVMGLTASSVTNSDTLSRLGIDSMQMVEVSCCLET